MESTRSCPDLSSSPTAYRGSTPRPSGSALTRAERALERGHDLGHRRLGNAQLASRRGHAPAIHQPDEGPQLPELEIQRPAILAMRCLITRSRFLRRHFCPVD
jgi:hypothetical protein